MYKSASRNLLSRAFRSAGKSLSRRISGRQIAKKIAAKRKAKRERDKLTETVLRSALGRGPEFVRKIYARFERDFEQQGFEIKRCSAFLNTVAGSRMLDGSLWTDRAVESMFRRMRPPKRIKK